MVRAFINTCKEIGCKVSDERMEFASCDMVFLGILLDGIRHVLAIPQDKAIKATNMLKFIFSKKKVTIKQIQKLTGLLNFLQRAIVPGRAFTRRMYDKLKITDKNGNPLKQFHHIRVDEGFRQDFEVWLIFLQRRQHDKLVLCRPFIDLSKTINAQKINFYSDASLCKTLGFGAVFQDSWIYGAWGSEFIEDQSPSIEFLELFALCAGVLTWSENLINTRVIVFCDNQAVVQIVNNMTSKCPKCMKLVRILVEDICLYA